VIQNLIIQNLLFIESVSLDFKAGFVALTGETGAGKSLILKALDFVCGGKTSILKPKDPHKNTVVSLVLDLPDNPTLKKSLEEHGLFKEDELILRRVFLPSQKNKCYVNDIPVSLNFLKELSEYFIEFVGQFEAFALTSPQYHLNVLDEFHPHPALEKSLQESFEAWHKLGEDREHNQQNLNKLLEEEEFYKFSLTELEELKPEPGEEALLLSERSQLMQRDKIIETLHKSIVQLDAQQGALKNLYGSEKILTKLPLDNQKDLVEAFDNLHHAACLVEESLIKIEDHKRGIEKNLTSLEDIEKRLYALRDLARKYRKTVDDLLNLKEELHQKLDRILELTKIVNQQDEKLQDYEKEYQKLAYQLFEHRKTQAAILDQSVNQNLKMLHWEHVQFNTEIIHFENQKPHKKGIDQVTFCVKTNPGQPFEPIGKVASGGERSRLLLALKAALSQKHNHQVLIFDEIDTGVGGKTAEAIGRVLKKLSNQGQVIAITHAPQVASIADQHFIVIKTVENQNSTTYCLELNAQNRVEEIARMLSGKTITEEARGAALQLLKVS
jgi:DNA repair protein RecN (Recombination protein N)